MTTTFYAHSNIFGVNQAELEIKPDPNVSGSDPFMQFHRPGVYAANFGLDSNNQFVFGGFSDGDKKYKFWTEKNFNPAQQKFGPNDQLVLEAQTDPGDNKSRLRLYRPNLVSDSYYADLLLERNLVGKNFAVTSGTTSQLRVNTDTGSGGASQWAVLSSMNVMEASSAHHCALYGQLNKKANASSWALCLEMRNHFGNTTTSAVAAEIGVNSNGLDDYNCVIGIDLVYNSGTPFFAGDNVVSAGLRIGPAYGTTNWYPGTENSDGVSQTTGRSILKRGVEIAGNVQTGIDLTRMVTTFSTEAIKLSSNQLLRWTDGSAFGFNGDGMFLNVAPGALRPGRPMPSSTQAGIVVNVGGLGPCLLPLIPLT